MKHIKASTLSVIQANETSVHCYVEAYGQSCNVTLRFDRGSSAMVCGYPETWDVHDVPVDQYDHDSPTGAELFEADGIRDGRTYISAADEAEILKQLRKRIVIQFSKWQDCPKEQRQTVLNKIDQAIAALNVEVRS